MDAIPGFGVWLKRRRKALDLTQQALANQVGCSIVTIRKLESDEQRPSRQLAERLAVQLAIPAEKQSIFVRFARQGLDAAPPELPIPAAARLPPTPPAPSMRWEHQGVVEPALPGCPNNLPLQPMSFVGREHELVVLRQRLLDPQTRLLTLTGPGGVGKTRLALQVGGDVLDHFADGVWFVDLAPISDPALVAPTIAQTLGLKEAVGQPILETLKSYLREKHVLLVLDNFEQVVTAAPVVDAMVRVAPRLKVLVTSRFVVGVYGEQDVVVEPMALPDPQQAFDVVRLHHVEAVRLFVERAQAAKADFTLAPANAEAVAGICQRLDGLPLAIELAAARIRHFPPQLLWSRLDRRLSVLTCGPRTLAARQQTLRNTIDWTYHLLSAAEQTLFARLGIFVGGFTIEAAETVCRGEDDRAIDTLEALASLVDKRLLRQTEGSDGEARFTMLETIREYSLERLETNAEDETLRRRHAAYYLGLVRPIRGWTITPEHEVWLERFEQEHDNLRAALRWSIDQGELETAAQLAVGLWWCWNTRGYTGEGCRWFAQILARRDALPGSLQAQVLNVAGFLAWLQGELEQAAELQHESLRLAQASGDQAGMALTLMYLGRINMTRGDYRQAEREMQAGLEIFRALRDDYGLVIGLRSLAEIRFEQGEYAGVIALLNEVLPINTRFGDIEHGINI